MKRRAAANVATLDPFELDDAATLAVLYLKSVAVYYFLGISGQDLHQKVLAAVEGRQVEANW